MNEFYKNLAIAGMVVGFILALDFVLELILIRNIKDKKKSLKFRVFLRYLLVFMFFFSMAKIWVAGFGFFLTFIGVIAAALTITQKEYLMNFFGWLIIMWRDLFAEGDYIEIGRYSGYVKQIGPLYFSLEEACDLWSDKTGRNIKIPNSLISNNPVVNFSIENSFVERKVYVIFSLDSSVQALRELIAELEKEIIQLLGTLYGDWTSKQQKQLNKLSQFSSYKPQFIMRIHQNIPIGIQLRIRFLSLRQDQKNIEDNIFTLIMAAVEKNPDLKISAAT